MPQNLSKFHEKINNNLSENNEKQKIVLKIVLESSFNSHLR